MDDDQMSESLVGTWSYSGQVPSPNGSMTQWRVVMNFEEDGQLSSDWAYAFNNGSAEIQGHGSWQIQGGILTMNVTNWESNFSGVITHNYGPPPQFDDGPSSPIEFLTRNSFKAHGLTFIRH